MTITPLPVISTIGVVVEAVADCLCAQIVADGRPDVCYCGVVPGAVAIADRIGSCGEVCGMAWVRLDQIYPATAPGVPLADTGNCDTPLAVDIEVGILRCVDAEPADQDLAESVLVQIADAETMIRAVRCCPALPAKDTLLAPYTPLGPDGATVGGTILISTMVY